MWHRTASLSGVVPIRAIVASYLILATLAGPSVCCCTVGRLAAQFAATIRPTKLAAEHVPSCCKHSPAKRHAPSKDSSREDNDPAPGDSPSCPCDRDHARVGAVEDTLAAIRIASVSFEPTDVARTDASAGIVLADRTLQADNDVFLDVDELLRAMHFLRC